MRAKLAFTGQFWLVLGASVLLGAWSASPSRFSFNDALLCLKGIHGSDVHAGILQQQGFSIAAVPEPSSTGLLILAGLSLLFLLRRHS